MPDGRLRLDSGVTLDRGASWLTRSEAEDAGRAADMVIYSWFPVAEDISSESDRIRGLIARVEAKPSDVGARLYAGSGMTILTLVEFH